MQTAQALAQAEVPHVPAALAPGPQPAMPAAAPAAASPLPPAGQAEILRPTRGAGPWATACGASRGSGRGQPLPPAGQAEIPRALAAPALGNSLRCQPRLRPCRRHCHRCPRQRDLCRLSRRRRCLLRPRRRPLGRTRRCQPGLRPSRHHYRWPGRAGMPHAPAAPMFPQLLGQQAVGGLLAQMLALPPAASRSWLRTSPHYGYVPPPAGRRRRPFRPSRHRNAMRLRRTRGSRP